MNWPMVLMFLFGAGVGFWVGIIVATVRLFKGIISIIRDSEQ